MNKFYLIIFFMVSALVTNAQAFKAGDVAFGGYMQSKVIKFYPNPASSVINFEFSKPVQLYYILQIYNFTGKKVYELTSISQKTTVALSDFFRGIYVFQLRDKSGRIIESGKFQVNK